MKLLLIILICYFYKFCLMANDMEESLLTVSISPIEKDLSEDNWIEVINSTIYYLQKTYHPGIDQKRINSFKEEMLNDHDFSIIKLQNALKKHFAVGHLGILRNNFDIDEIIKTIDIKYPEKKISEIFGLPYKGLTKALLYNKQQISDQDIKNIIKNSKIITLNILNTKDGDIPLIKIKSFKERKGDFYKEVDSIREKLTHNYPHIILDLRDNEGGRAEAVYYFLATFLGGKDPDIRPVTVYPDLLMQYQIPAKNIEDSIRITSYNFHSFYEEITFGGHQNLIDKARNLSQEISFKKMVVLINKNIFSGGEISTATLKSTLGSKICILGMPGKGSFEEAGQTIDLPHKFILYLPDTKRFFYSVRTKKLLTGLHLLPDIEHQDMSTIIDKSIEVLTQPSFCPNDASYGSIPILNRN